MKTFLILLIGLFILNTQADSYRENRPYRDLEGDPDRPKEDTSQLYKHSGLEHHSGVTSGGTFILNNDYQDKK